MSFAVKGLGSSVRVEVTRCPALYLVNITFILDRGVWDAVLHSLCRSSLNLHSTSFDTIEGHSPRVGGTSHQALRSLGSSSILLEHGVFTFTPTIENGWPALPGGASTTPGRAI